MIVANYDKRGQAKEALKIQRHSIDRKWYIDLYDGRKSTLRETDPHERVVPRTIYTSGGDMLRH